ncbi:hypothetical protein CERSUDRAFT_105032 [Gelatoporia subvermispora B]|uniref:Voltage-gated hydrogen channel 1 n=1 Tax=Ceriporiopsis subvermispora (strain B) TaxID=914234 RepID=M2R1R0_CERS8|nr:hypothetical protein CERSUDRAFT_105032 [Gelatoporia subvermispora B]
MSEEDPLLSSLPRYNDPENPGGTDEPDKQQTWREWTAEMLESPPLHKTVIALVIIDSACVLADLSYTFLSESCTPVEGPEAPLWLNILAHISLAINTFFLIEIPLTIWSQGLGFYNPRSRVPHASLHLFDAIVILTTFTLEVVLRGREQELAGLLIILRLWRLVKLVQGIAVSAGELEEGQARVFEETREELEQVIVALTEARKENQSLKSRIVALEGASGDD